MVRFIGVCILLAGLCAGGVVLLGDYMGINPANNGPAEEARDRKIAEAIKEKDDQKALAEVKAEPLASQPFLPDRPVRITGVSVNGGTAQPIIIQDGRVLPLERQEVPSERDGKLMLLATPVSQDEFVPKDKEVRLEVALLGVEWREGEGDRIGQELSQKRPAIKEPFEDPRNPGKLYRFPRPGDSLAPGSTKIIRLNLRFRKLSENDEVEKDQLLGIINPSVALEELAIKQSKVDSAAADVRATQAMKEESARRLMQYNKARAKSVGSISDDEIGAAKVTVDRYVNEEIAKKASVVQAQQELSGAWTTLELYFIRAAIPGRIRTIYKQPGEAVKNLDNVLQIQNSKKLRVEAAVEVQDALPLQDRLAKAERMRTEARTFDKSKPAYAKELRDRADQLTQVQVEVTRPVSPRAVLSGHLQEVTCVGVTKGPNPLIASGSEEGLVRIWERLPGEDRWQEKVRLDHGVPVRALACSGPGANSNRLITGTSRGTVRIFDIDQVRPGYEPSILGQGDEKARHQGSVAAIAINPNGTLCATGGEDRSITVWNLETMKAEAKKKGAHNSMITSLIFTPSGKLISVGRDKRIIIWDLSGNSLTENDEVSGRSNEVSTLGLDPSGDRILFDEGRELRILSLSTKRIEGSLINSGASGSFSTLALFSPDGRTILTNGNGPGRLQLWRAPSREHRAAELRQLLWTTGNTTTGAFDPSGKFAVTGTSDHRVLVWDLPAKDEAEKPLDAQLTFVEEFLDTSLKRLTIRATLQNVPDGVIPGSSASIVVPPKPNR
ncbi:MAG: HlyD family efflux transporter periplasmic adaptor subunit [Gemmataceae bacterium]